MAGPEPPLPLPPLPRGGPGSASLSPPRGDRTLLVRHLPAELTAEEKEDLLKYFGAQSVRVLSDKGRLVSGGWRGRRAGPGRGEGDLRVRGVPGSAVITALQPLPDPVPLYVPFVHPPPDVHIFLLEGYRRLKKDSLKTRGCRAGTTLFSEKRVS